MRNKAENDANTVEQYCNQCGGAHPDRDIQIAKQYAVVNGVCPEKPLPGDGRCDRCDAVLSRETATKVRHFDDPRDARHDQDHLTVCERCVGEIRSGGSD